MTDITVVIPVGPLPVHSRWLHECVESVRAQTLAPAEILLIDDMHGLPALSNDIRVWYSPWLLGVPHAFNFGVALAKTELVFMLGSDDLMAPRCLELCAREYGYQRELKGDAALDCYYFVGVDYIDNVAKAQFLPCGEAMVSKTLWKKTGGFPIESSVGMCDSVFMSMIWNRPEFPQVGVGGGESLVHYRHHPETDSNVRRGLWHPLASAVVNIKTANFEPPAWGRFE